MFFQICLRDATLCYITLHHVTFWRLTGPPAAFSVLRAMSPWRICLHWSNWSSRRRAPISLEQCGDELQSSRRMPFGGDQNEARKSSLGASTTGATKLPINASRVRSEARFRPATWCHQQPAPSAPASESRPVRPAELARLGTAARHRRCHCCLPHRMN